MGFLSAPKIPDIPPAATPASPAIKPPEETTSTGTAPSAASLISTSVNGLRRRATTQRTSLIGGA